VDKEREAEKSKKGHLLQQLAAQALVGHSMLGHHAESNNKT
jgi:hypothetical protein